MLQEAGHISNTIVLVFRHIQCLHLMIFWVDWEQVFSRTEVLREILLNPGYLPDYLFVLMTMLLLLWFNFATFAVAPSFVGVTVYVDGTN